MGLFSDTIRDARRPLPGGATWLRRAAVDDAPVEADEPADPAALTVFRLQKEGGGSPSPRAPVRQPEAAARTGPSTGSRAPKGGAPGDGPATRASQRQALPSVETEKASEQHESQFIVQEASSPKSFSRGIPSPKGVDTSWSLTGPQSSNHVRDSQSEADRPTEDRYRWRREARGAPSGDPFEPVAPVPPAGPLDEAAGYDAAPAATPAAAPWAASPAARDGLSDTAPPGPAIAPATAPARAAAGPLRHAATTAAQAVPEAALGVPGDRPDSVATVPAVTRPTLASPSARAPMASARPPAMTPAAPAPPSLRIGRIDVTVLADTPRAAPRADAGGLDPHFLSRHYLRRT